MTLYVDDSWRLGGLYAVVRLVFFILVTRRKDIPFVHGAPKNLQQIQRSFAAESEAAQDQSAFSSTFGVR